MPDNKGCEVKDYYIFNGKPKLLREIAGPTSEKDLQQLKADRITLLRTFKYDGNNSRLRSYDGHDLLIFVGQSGPLIITLDGAQEFASAIYTAAASIEERATLVAGTPGTLT